MKKAINPNTLAYPNPVWCVGSYDLEGKANVMTIAWGGICSSKPLALTVSLRKERYSFAGILERKAYTVSVPSTRYVAEADYFGIVSGSRVDKFKATGLTPAASSVVDAPYVSEFPLVIECALINVVEVGIHTQLIGEIKGILADEEVLNDKDFPMMDKVDPFVFGAGIREYWGLGELAGKAFDAGKKFKA